MSAATPGQALSPDPADFAYHVRATAFNVLTGKMAGDEWSVPRSERDAIARAVVDAVEPLIRADERALAAQEPHAAPLWPDGAPVRDADGEAQPAPEMAAVEAERDGLRNALRAIELGIAEPSPKSVAKDALNGRYFDPMNDSGVWHIEPALKAVPEPQPTPELTHTREDVIASYNAGYIAAVDKDARPAPELAAAIDAIEKVVQSHERAMYAAAIDIRHGQPGEARRLLGEQLDGWDGPEWDGTETGAQYLERTREGS